MAKRSTIADVAKAANVSISTVNRILNGSGLVRPETVRLVQDAAEQVGFYGLGTIKARSADKTRHRLGFLLQQSHRPLYQIMGQAILDAAAARSDYRIDAEVVYADDLSPGKIASELEALGQVCDAVAIIAADHPLISQAIEQLSRSNTPVIAYITDQSSPFRAGYVGTDNWKLGRTAAWLISQMTSPEGTVAVFIGNHRYQCQDLADVSFRSYMREHAPGIKVLDSVPTQEESQVAYELVKELIQNEPDLTGIFIVGGGITGVLEALREAPESILSKIRLICRDMGPATQRGLGEELITAALCHPIERVSAELVDTLINSLNHKNSGSIVQRSVPFDIVTPANV